jgi:XapX domain-containing protein
MKPYLVALAIGLMVGAIYSLLGTRSPAPPAIALLGLLGMLLGEQAVPLAKRVMHGQEVALFWKTNCAERVTGLPQAQDETP